MGLLIAFGAMEIGLRLVLTHYLNPFQPDAVVGYRLKPNFAGRYPWVPVRTDEGGFRVPDTHARSSRSTILFVGDSVTFGFGVLAEDSYPARFGERIGRPGDVVNAAVPGYNLEQALAAVRRFIANGQKPELVVYGLCLNDIAGADHPSTYEDIDPHASRARGNGLLSSSMLLSVLDRRLKKLRAPAPSGPPPADTKESLLSDLSSPLLQSELPIFDREWSELEDVQRTTGIPIVVVVLPYRQQIVQHPEWRAPQQYLQQKCSTSPLRCLDPSPMLEEHRSEDLYTPTSSMHFSQGGNQLLAAWLADSLRDLLTRPAERRPPA
jgi:lysophospholipase L1-like esterase